MIQLQTILVPADNTGANKLRLIHIYGGSRRRYARLGDLVRVVVDGADPNGLVKDAESAKAVVVRVHKEMRRHDGSYIRFDDNAAVMIDKEGLPRGTRIFGPVAREIKDRGYYRIASLAAEVL
jgi:large subunit ribosomal protein L14